MAAGGKPAAIYYGLNFQESCTIYRFYNRIYLKGCCKGMTNIVTPNYMNFSWLIENELAGHRGIQSDEHLQFLRDKGVRALIRMTQRAKVTVVEIEKAGMIDYHLSIPDMSAPDLNDIDLMIGFIEKCLSESKPVGVSCDGGYGRTGCLLSCFFIARGMEPLDAISFVKDKRPGSILTEEQDQAVHKFAAELKTRPGSHKHHR
jgi:atypical dual specificity phosphatase